MVGYVPVEMYVPADDIRRIDLETKKPMITSAYIDFCYERKYRTGVRVERSRFDSEQDYKRYMSLPVGLRFNKIKNNFY